MEKMYSSMNGFQGNYLLLLVLRLVSVLQSVYRDPLPLAFMVYKPRDKPSRYFKSIHIGRFLLQATSSDRFLLHLC